MKKQKINIIIVTYNSEKYINKCIKSIEKCELDTIDLDITIIDNFSTDKTREILNRYEKRKNIFIIKNSINFGFAHAVNQGIKKNIKADFVLLLNPDTVLNNNSILNLIKCAEKHDSGITGGSTVDFDGYLNGSYFRFPTTMVGLFDFTNLRKLCIKDKWHKYFYYQDSNDSILKEFPVDIVTGGFMLISKKTIKKIGLFDEIFFMYLEDADYCLRAKKAGIDVYHTNLSTIFHYGGASSGNRDRIRHLSWLKSRKIYFYKHFGLIENIILQPIFLIDDALILISKAIKK